MEHPGSSADDSGVCDDADEATDESDEGEDKSDSQAAAEQVDGNGPDTPVTPARLITSETLEATINRAVVRYDRDGDQHYDIISAFIKSVRGSDVDAALHYLARMIEGGEDPRFIARRLIILASEDIGMADPTAMPAAVAAAQAVQLIGMPEGRLSLAQATIHLALAPKSNAVITAIDGALADVRQGKSGPVPRHLRDGHYEGAKRVGAAIGYRYPHDDPRGVVTQRYNPETLDDATYFVPTGHGREAGIQNWRPRCGRSCGVSSSPSVNWNDSPAAQTVERGCQGWCNAWIVAVRQAGHCSQNASMHVWNHGD